MAKRKKNKGQNTDASAPIAKNKNVKDKGAKSSAKDRAKDRSAQDESAKSSESKSGKKNPWDRGKSKSVEDNVGTAAGAKGNSAKGSGKTSSKKRAKDSKSAQQADYSTNKNEMKKDYFFSMSHAPRLDEDTPMHWIQLIPAALFTAVVILLVKRFDYARDMSQYYWSSETSPPAEGTTNLVEFFSHYKVELIGWSALLMGIMVAYRIMVQQFAVKRTHFYWPIFGYLLFVLLSYIFSDNKDVAWGGWNDRFEGTAVILCYFVAVLFIMNSVNSERNIKFIIYPIAAVTVVLSVLGLSQATGHDFFQSTAGQKLLVPNTPNAEGAYPWDLIDQAAEKGEQYLKFTFQNNEIYQTVYNINYVSFYLTLLIPLFAMMFIWSKGLVKKAIWGVIFALTVFNFFGAASSGGMLGVSFTLVLVVLILRKKLIQWWRPLVILVVIVVAVGAADVALVNHNGKGVKFLDELKGGVEGVLPANASASEVAGDAAGGDSGDTTAYPGTPSAEGVADAAAVKNPLSRIDWFKNEDNTAKFSVDGNVATMAVHPDGSITVTDDTGAGLELSQSEDTQEILINDDRFKNIYILGQADEDGSNFLSIKIRGDDARSWPFILTGDDKSTLMFRNDLKKDVALEEIPHIGFGDNINFGNGRGYIWATSLPLVKDTIFIGNGADTYCLEFPHKDYIGKYNADWDINMIVDKPHNMYLATAINTGVTSLIALLVLFLMYIIQSIRLYWRRKFTTFAEFAGAGIFFGTSGFMVTGIVDDSTVSVMPMFYGLLATGIATNIMLKKRYGDAKKTNEGEAGAGAGNETA